MKGLRVPTEAEKLARRRKVALEMRYAYQRARARSVIRFEKTGICGECD